MKISIGGSNDKKQKAVEYIFRGTIIDSNEYFIQKIYKIRFKMSTIILLFLVLF